MQDTISSEENYKQEAIVDKKITITMTANAR
jgi:hypothetical protein